MEEHEHRPGHPAASRRATLSIFVLGLAAVNWIVVRLLPMPDRASYPSLSVAVSLASGRDQRRNRPRSTTMYNREFLCRIFHTAVLHGFGVLSGESRFVCVILMSFHA